MSFYTQEISKRFNAPKNTGRAKAANAAGTSATFVCGAVLRCTLLIEKDSKIIKDAKFQTDGCGFLIAAADVLTENILGKKLPELHGLDEKILKSEIENILGAFPVGRTHCLNLALESLQNAFADFRAAQIEEWAGEKALICTCFGVSEEKIEKLISEKSLQTVREITEVCNAGGGCGSCQPLIQEILDSPGEQKLF